MEVKNDKRRNRMELSSFRLIIEGIHNIDETKITGLLSMRESETDRETRARHTAYNYSKKCRYNFWSYFFPSSSLSQPTIRNFVPKIIPTEYLVAHANRLATAIRTAWRWERSHLRLTAVRLLRFFRIWRRATAYAVVFRTLTSENDEIINYKIRMTNSSITCWISSVPRKLREVVDPGCHR